MTNQQANGADEISEIIQVLNNSDDESRVTAMVKFRQILSTEDNYNKEEIIQSGVAQKCVEFLQMEENPNLQYEACWCLTNIAAGTTEETKTVVDAGAVPILIKLISCNCEELQEQAVWALANIIGDGPENRDLVLKEGIMVPLLRFLWNSQQISAIKNAVWTLANLCRENYPTLDYKKFSFCLPVLSCMLFHNDIDILTNTCEALADFCEGSSDNIRAIVDTGFCKRLIELLTHTHQSVVSPALRILFNIISSDDIEYTQMIIDLSVLPKLLTLLKTSSEESIREQIFRIMSDIVAGNTDQKQAVIDAGLIPVLLDILDDCQIDTKREAEWVIIHLTCKATCDQIKYIVEQGCIPPLLNMLSDSDTELIKIVLACIKLLLNYGEIEAIVRGGYNRYAQVIRNCHGLDKISQLKFHADDEIRTFVDIIIENYSSRKQSHPGIIAEIVQQLNANIPIEELPM